MKFEQLELDKYVVDTMSDIVSDFTSQSIITPFNNSEQMSKLHS